MKGKAKIVKQATNRSGNKQIDLNRSSIKGSIQEPIPLWASPSGPALVGKMSSLATSLGNSFRRQRVRGLLVRGG